MAGSSILDSFRQAPWLTRRRLVAYPRLFLAVYFVSAVVWMLRSKGLIDPAGHPIGADFIDPWSASWLTLHGAPSFVYDVARLWSVERTAVADPAVGFAGFHYPPIYLLIILPLALIPYAMSLLAWTVTTFAAYLATMWTIDPERDSLWLAIAFPGALVNLTNGQNGFLTLALLGGGLLTIDRRPILAGVMFGLMSYKPQYGILIPIFLLATRRWRAIASASVTVVILAALSFAIFGAQTWHAFFSSITFTRQVVLEQGGSGFEKLQSAFAAARLWGFSVATAYVVQAAVALIAAIIVIWIWWRTPKFELHAAALATGVLLMTPYMMDYDLVLLALPIAWIALEARRNGFLPYEKALLAFVWLLPLFARSLAGSAKIPIAPLAILLLLADVARRALAPREQFALENAPQNPHLTRGFPVK
ncbi:glycosyltransferase family 87 protein [Candidatus Binatus sp.]|uniref:glycosyltransferase family 87 protein n=1 Tax=Candidatus Binatus sp. TaxID=2811406 RepID=UPI003CBA9ECE